MTQFDTSAVGADLTVEVKPLPGPNAEMVLLKFLSNRGGFRTDCRLALSVVQLEQAAQVLASAVDALQAVALDRSTKALTDAMDALAVPS